ncbi:hypothetical protein AYI70_g1118 [Smittium culicis]|uniref:Stress-associated endoplasmic reticulum protein n=2 Tax=Smittium culicis TaxID=133412 RepID=A0A1R1YDY3_9FUNG|nr:hypothetical protein AYI70_g1118 [Smittium culicis]
MPLPANIRKRSEKYNENITKRGNVKVSLDPKKEEKLLAAAAEKAKAKAEARARAAGKSLPEEEDEDREQEEQTEGTPRFAKKRTFNKQQYRLVLGIVVLFLVSVIFQLFAPLITGGGKAPTRKVTKKSAFKTATRKAAKPKATSAKVKFTPVTSAASDSSSSILSEKI